MHVSTLLPIICPAKIWLILETPGFTGFFVFAKGKWLTTGFAGFSKA
ncbi:MAG: hypothetical protein HZA67_07635 [Rhodospirillales bacterium]|jgi:hypothetical protein|nr:hypothetical protein [Rhodospirillales bacterium]